MDEHREEVHAEQPKQKHGSMSKVTYYALIVIFAAVFVLAGIYLGGYFLETGSAQQDYDALASIYQENTRGTSPSTSGENAGTQKPQEPTILPELQAIYNLNDDLVGYLNFPYDNLNLKYPVMQTPEDSDYYLNHDFYGNESIAGCPYVPDDCDVFKPTDKVILYGHNLKTGGMFNKLTYYREKSYWQTHQTFYFDTLYERHTYQIFAVFKTAAHQIGPDGEPWGYPFHRNHNFETKEEFDKFIADIKGAAFESGKYQGWTFYDTGITPQFGDKILCLATCEYTMRDPDGTIDGRLIVAAVRIE